MKIAIDGPSGAGKSTISKAVAAKLGIVYVDTGALYRTVGYYVRSVNVDPHDAEAVAGLLGQINIELKYENGVQKVYLNGVDLGDKIRTQEISMYASAVSAIPAVRAFLLDTQRNIAAANSVIMDGRDIGTVILPDAEVKIFLTASPEQRAKRRYIELKEKGMEADYDQILAETIKRDADDSNRSAAPLRPADDAIRFDNSDYTFDESVDFVINAVNNKMKR